ncbi:uncharacterized protein MELLADRAFT_73214 [Melampsora larici-populina 98AG31]|uniref:Uncharacterized protein n=1 Tax=Melampsora larici-populina (strain 98AG31 / pathotype 3-4-7) TaxID=747676 RepID=F4S4Y9_MELLP|nr:uncharacterized protein MELLADRAFT_73214 [Melampsora larici-populina 98AG31]EGG00298.1 hypothetical protein MELLADRAFT_73214 [Melampsora larici-populina 98AG31]
MASNLLGIRYESSSNQPGLDLAKKWFEKSLGYTDLSSELNLMKDERLSKLSNEIHGHLDRLERKSKSISSITSST